MYNYSIANVLAYMEFTILVIIVGHLDPDTPLTNVQASVTRIILWRVVLTSLTERRPLFLFHDVIQAKLTW